MIRSKGWSKTDVGRVRRQNEDACFVYTDDQRTIGIVCDGMGGANAGEVASGMAVRIFSQALLEGGRSPEELIRQGLEKANREVYRHSRSHPACRGMGTTMVAVFLLDTTAYILNVGDSRCYAAFDGQIRQITCDHSLVQEMVQKGIITQEQAKYHPHRNIITRALGTEPSIYGDLFVHPVRSNERLLLCSDGLCNELTDQELLELLSMEPAEEACSRLIQAALDNGARDNVTAVVIDLQDTANQ